MSSRPLDQKIESLIAREAATGESRRHKRTSVTLSTEFLLPDGEELQGTVTDISAGGAFVTSTVQAVVDDHVTMRVEDVGQLQGKVVRVTPHGFATQFDHKRSRAIHVADRLIGHINGAVLGIDRRTEPRHVADEAAIITLEDGQQSPCRVTDISVGGAFLATKIKPLVGSKIKVGKHDATVVRHDERGIGVAFALSHGDKR